MKKLPRRFISFEFPGVRFNQLRASLFIRINARAVFFSRRERLQPVRLHSFLFDKSFGFADVYRAPDAGGFARREPDHVTVFIDALANAVDPSEAQSFIDRLGPGDAGFASMFLVEADPELFRFGVIGREPFAENRGCFEEFGIHVNDGSRLY